MTLSRSTPVLSIASRSWPKTLMPIGVRMPVVSMSTLFLIGCVKAFVHPGIWSFSFISWTRSSRVMGTNSGQTAASAGRAKAGVTPTYQRRTYFVRHSLLGLRRMTVSTMESGAGSVGVSARPILPRTLSTSGNSFRIASCFRSWFLASSMEMFGSVVGM